MSGVSVVDLQVAVKRFEAEVARLAVREAERTMQMQMHELKRRAPPVAPPVVVKARSTPKKPARVAIGPEKASGATAPAKARASAPTPPVVVKARSTPKRPARVAIDLEKASGATAPAKARAIPPVVVEVNPTPDRPATVAIDLDDASGVATSSDTAPVTSGAKSPSRPRWNRDTIINELLQWIATGIEVHPAFLKRYGPRGLVSAIKKEFGRFDAGLNVASLQFEARYPLGSPQRAQLDLRRAQRCQRGPAV